MTWHIGFWWYIALVGQTPGYKGKTYNWRNLEGELSFHAGSEERSSRDAEREQLSTSGGMIMIIIVIVTKMKLPEQWCFRCISLISPKQHPWRKKGDMCGGRGGGNDGEWVTRKIRVNGWIRGFSDGARIWRWLGVFSR